MALAHSIGIWIGGNQLDIRYNRIGYRERDSIETRVLHIEGPNDKMN
jgi:hypothetical protein